MIAAAAWSFAMNAFSTEQGGIHITYVFAGTGTWSGEGEVTGSGLFVVEYASV